MKRVFDLATELTRHPEKMAQTQALTLDQERPAMGLKGSHGLYGSEVWWQNIRNGELKTGLVSGIILAGTFAGQDARWGDQINSFKLQLEDGSTLDESIYCQHKPDRKHFRPGRRVMIAYVFDELKAPAHDGEADYLRMVIEMAVSLD